MFQENGNRSLPWELLELFIDNLGSNLDDVICRSALVSCTLVCRSFHFHASGYLFSNIELTPKGGQASHVKFSRRLANLHHILQMNPTLAPRIKVLTIETWFGSISPTRDRALLLDNPLIPIVFPRLSCITSFSWINHDMVFPWSLFSEPVAEAFANLMSVSSLTSLTFEGIEDLPVDYITRCSNLRHLRLVHIDHVGTDHELSTDLNLPAQQTAKLHTMTNRNAPEILLHILADGSISSAMFSQLRALHMWMRKSEEARAAWAIMESASQTLELLDIEDMSHFGYPEMIPGPMDLGTLRKLRTVKMACIIASGDWIFFPMGICGLLSPPTSPCTIENIEITIDWIDCRIGTEEDRFTREPVWTTLDETLSRHSTFPHLRQVTLTLNLGYGWSNTLVDPPDRIVEVKDHIQQLASRLLPVLSRIPTVKTNINLRIYNSPYASNSAFY